MAGPIALIATRRCGSVIAPVLAYQCSVFRMGDIHARPSWHLQGVPIVVIAAWLGYVDPGFTTITHPCSARIGSERATTTVRTVEADVDATRSRRALGWTYARILSAITRCRNSSTTPAGQSSQRPNLTGQCSPQDRRLQCIVGGGRRHGARRHRGCVNKLGGLPRILCFRGPSPQI